MPVRLAAICGLLVPVTVAAALVFATNALERMIGAIHPDARRLIEQMQPYDRKVEPRSSLTDELFPAVR